MDECSWKWIFKVSKLARDPSQNSTELSKAKNAALEDQKHEAVAWWGLQRRSVKLFLGGVPEGGTPLSLDGFSGFPWHGKSSNGWFGGSPILDILIDLQMKMLQIRKDFCAENSRDTTKIHCCSAMWHHFSGFLDFKAGKWNLFFIGRFFLHITGVSHGIHCGTKAMSTMPAQAL